MSPLGAPMQDTEQEYSKSDLQKRTDELIRKNLVRAVRNKCRKIILAPKSGDTNIRSVIDAQLKLVLSN